MKSNNAATLTLTETQQQQVIAATRKRVHQASRLFNIETEDIAIRFNLKGRSAGMYRIRHQGGLLHRTTEREIRYNPYIFARYFEDNLATTVPHEVAHYISDLLYGLKNIRPHGQEWKTIMQALGADTSVTARYDLSGLPHRRMQRFAYVCNCREHQLTAIRHNRIQRSGYRYLCACCKQPLQLQARPDCSEVQGSSP